MEVRDTSVATTRGIGVNIDISTNALFVFPLQWAIRRKRVSQEKLLEPHSFFKRPILEPSVGSCL
jgi:hypothetical protein